MFDPRHAIFTTIEVTIRGKALDARPVHLVTAQAGYLVPNPLPVRDIVNFFPDGGCKFVALGVPLFYSGRIFFAVKPSQVSDQAVEVDLIKVEVYNLPSERQTCPRSSICREPMRILYGRNNCLPKSRIAGLRRYAFIGDSFIYGHGVAPNQTLPAAAERQMNDYSAYPVEAVNLGINGYNLWNSWLGFKSTPQVYDGLIITLCCNDMEFFGRSYSVEYKVPRSPAWENTHACGQAVASCFADISAFSRELSLPIAVCYYNTFEGSSPARIGEIIGDLCESYGFPFINSLVVLRGLHFSTDDLRVSEADDHPSASVHEAIGRSLVQTLRRQGWFAEHAGTTATTIADRVMSSAQAMMEMDHYPPEVAQHWALRTMDIQLHRVRRSKALSADDQFAAIRPERAAEVAEINRYWHTSQRIRAFLARLWSIEQGVAWAWYSAEEEWQRLEELSFALATGNWRRLSQGLTPHAAPREAIDQEWPLEASDFLDSCVLDIQRCRKALATMPDPPLALAAGSWPDTAMLTRDVETLSHYAGRIAGECCRLKEAFNKVERTIAGLSADKERAFSNDEMEHISSLADTALQRTRKALAFVQTWPGKIEHLSDSRYATFTTIEVTIRGKALEDKPPCMITAHAEYLVPGRMPSMDNGNFVSDGSCKFVTLTVPIFYSGRILLSIRNSLSGLPAEVELIKVKVHNLADERLEISPPQFSRDPFNRFVSPIIYLS